MKYFLYQRVFIFKFYFISQDEALVCEKCGKVMGTRSSLNSHLMKQHNNDGNHFNAPKRRHFLDLETKAKVIIELENGTSYYDVCKKYNVIESTVRSFRLNKEAIFKQLEEDKGRKIEFGVKKTLKKVQRPLVEEALFAWLVHQRRAGFYVDYSLVIKTARLINEKFHGTSDKFKASKGYVARFKSRFGLQSLNFNIEELPYVIDSSCMISDSLRQKMEELSLTEDDILNCVDVVGNQAKLKKTYLKNKKRILLKMKRMNNC